MADSITLPIASAWPSLPREFYVLFQQLASKANNVTIPDLTEVNARLDALESEGTTGLLISGGSLRFSGQLPGNVYASLDGDTTEPGKTQYYGSDSTGQKGWYAVSDAFDSTSGVTLTVGSDGVTTFDLADLADSGTGSALVKLTRDSKGRISGTSAATTDDLPGTDQHPYAVAVQATATIDLGSPRVVAVADGQAYYPDLSDGVDAQRIAGVTVASVATGGVATIRPTIQLTNALWSWSPGPIYCGPLGTLTQTAPTTGALIEVGRAISATEILISIHRAILR